MATMDEGSHAAPPARSREPLVGRGSVRRVEPAGSGDAGPGSFEDRDDRPRGEATVPRPSWTRPSRRRRWSRAGLPRPKARLGLGCAVVAVLAIAWVWVGRGATTEPAIDPGTTAVTRPAPTVEPVVVTVPRWVPDAIAATCGARRSESTGVVTVDCVPGRGVVSLQYRAFSSLTALRAAYAAAAPLVGGAGPPGCTRGAHEERSWSAPASPSVPSGRYRCLVAGGHARLVWSNERARVLAFASRGDGDLRSLFEWWTTVPGPEEK
jgi:hypothetical protein